MAPKIADLSDSADESLAILTAALDQAVAGRHALEAAASNLEERFRAGEPVADLVRLRSQHVDRLLVKLWDQHLAEQTSACALIQSVDMAVVNFTRTRTSTSWCCCPAVSRRRGKHP